MSDVENADAELKLQWEFWRAEIDALGVTNPLMNFEANTFGQIDLDRAHPNGMAQLVSGSTTPLTNLIRESLSYSRAFSAAKRIKAKSDLLHDHFGIDNLYIIAGLANLTADGFDLKLPILLWPINLIRRGDDFEVSISGQPKVNPALIESFEVCYGVRVDEQKLLSTLRGSTDLIPIDLLTQLNTMAAAKAHLDLRRILVAANFALAPTLMRRDIVPTNSGLVRALAGLSPEEPHTELPSSADAFLVADASATQRRIASRAVAGQSFAVETLPGCGYTQTVVNTLSALVANGRRVLVVVPRRQTLNELADRLAEVGLPGLGIRAHSTWLDLVAAISRNEKAKPAVIQATETLHRVGVELDSYHASLNQVHAEFGVSILQTLNQLSALSAMPHAPKNQARIARNNLMQLQNRTEALELLTSAQELGEFKFGPNDTAWYRAKFDSPTEVASTIELAIRLRDEQLPKLKKQLTEYVADVGFKPAETVQDWHQYLRLFVGLRDTLDKFKPDVFDRPIDDLIVANSERSEFGSMNGGTRRRLKKLSKEYLRPGMSVTNMSEALQAVREQRRLWQQYCLTQVPPQVPLGISEAQIALQGLFDDLSHLQRHLDSESNPVNLVDLPLKQLEHKLNSMASDTEVLANLGERVEVNRRLDALGLEPLLRELAANNCKKEHLASELELAWWQSVLQFQLADDPAIASHDAARLTKLENEYVDADEQLLLENRATLAAALAANWANALEANPEAAQRFKAQLKTGAIDLSTAAEAAADIWPAIAPVVMLSPYEVAGALAREARFDTLFVLDAAGTTVAENLSAIVRANQIIVFGDPAIAEPTGFEIEVRQKPIGRELPATSIFATVANNFDTEVLRRSYRTSGQALGDVINKHFYQDRIEFEPTLAEFFGNRNFNIEMVGTGGKAAAGESEESLDAEVEKVVDLVFNHALWHPEDSLLVATASDLHAQRITDAVIAGVASKPNLTEFFRIHGRENFEVVSLAHLTHRIADRIILSIGFGKNSRGKAPKQLGQLTEPKGRQWLANALVSARKQVTLVSCLGEKELTDSGLEHGGEFLHELFAEPKSIVDGIANADPMLDDLGIRLKKLGARVQRGLTAELPLVAAYSKEAAVVETDWSLLGENWSERLRLRPGLLRAMGWQYLRAYSFELFSEPDEIARRISAEIGVSVKPRTQPIFGEPAFEDTAEAWGDRRDSNDADLKQNRPPHWG